MVDMPTTNVRMAVARWLLTNVQDELPEHQVEPGYPGDNLQRKAVWVDEITGQFTQPIMTAGRRDRDDRFFIPLELRMVGVDFMEAFDLLDLTIAAIESRFADAHTLDDEVDGILSAELVDLRMLMGQGRTPADGFRAYGRMLFAFHARLI